MLSENVINDRVYEEWEAKELDCRFDNNISLESIFSLGDY